MTTLAVTGARFIGQQVLSTATSFAISTATSYVARAFDNRNFEGPRLESFHLQTSRDGAPMARVYGRVRLAGQVIWASHIREKKTKERVGGKGGGPTQTNYSYRISFAVGLCEGQILAVDRIWANGAPLKTHGLDLRIYHGTDTQNPDPIISATEGGNVPAFRNTAYLVFEDFPMDDYGGRLPQINAEIVRIVGEDTEEERLETLIESVNLLPGSGEFAYATEIVEVQPRPGQTRPANMNNVSGKPDLELALDQLDVQLPNCKNVSIISAWFGDSLNCGSCDIRPGVELDFRGVRNATWRVGRDKRGGAYLISKDSDGAPNFGGTPSDDSLIQAIKSLKRRGYSVTLYPFLMLDIAGFPWRGRITNTVDKAQATRLAVDQFFGNAQPSHFDPKSGASHHRGPDDGYRNFILTHANLARRAGGVDRFVIGSEMRALTRLRDENNNFPAVTELMSLAGAVKQMLGAGTGVTYAADWSEYFGYHPDDGSGDVYYNLDPLWAHSAISAVGIDAYFPLSDWRDGPHLDADISPDIYDLDYLRSNIEGGEGYDYYYASESDRTSQIRTPITDGLANKPWVYRYKDIRNWWSNLHYDRVGGQEATQASPWVPQSKPVWLTEIGCPAVGYGSNQPNLFSDGKSIDSGIPYFSDGSRDDLIQRNYLTALISYWKDTANNPVSTLTGQRMIDLDMAAVWAWDGRPFPDFPARLDVWSDGLNWQRGHWITGRMGLVPLSDVLEDICAQAGLNNVDVTQVPGVVSGYMIDRPMRARDALSPLLPIYDINLAETAGQVEFFSPTARGVVPVNKDDLIDQPTGPITYQIEDNHASLRDARLSYIDSSRDYQLGTISARNLQAETVRVGEFRAPIVLDPGQARAIVERSLRQSEPQRHSVEFSLTPEAARSLKAGARISLPDRDETWQVTRLQQGTQVDVTATALADFPRELTVSGLNPIVIHEPEWVSEPVALAFNLTGRDGLQVGVVMHPFQAVLISGPDAPSTDGEGEITVDSPLHTGTLSTDFTKGPLAVSDQTTTFDFWMPEADLVSRELDEVIAGENRFAVETDKGWEIIGVAELELVAADQYRASCLLRGLDNSDDAQASLVQAGARIIWLDEALQTIALSEDYIGQSVDVSVRTSDRSGVAANITYEAAHLKPLSPVHLRLEPQSAGVRLSWVPRNLDDSDMVQEASFQVAWAGGSALVTQNYIDLPFGLGTQGSQTLVEVAQINPELGSARERGGVASIWV